MAQDTITFCCPACGTKLTVPGGMAGIVGPCPVCRTRIQAPIPQRPMAGGGWPQAAPPAPAPVPSPAIEPPAPATSPAPESKPVSLRPEPRQLPQRSPAEIAAKQMPEPLAHPPRVLQPAPLPRHPYQKRRLLRALMLLVFLVASGALVYGVLTVLKMPPQQQPAENPAKQQREEKAPAATGQPADATSKPDTAGTATALPTPAADLARLTPESGQSPPVEPDSPWSKSEAALEKFLTAATLGERLPLIETRTPAAELEASCLARPLPPASRMVPEFRESNPLEEVVDCYYTVEFEGGGTNPLLQTVLVRTRGTGDPKVVADPFLDSYGGRLAAYAGKPTDKGGVFQVVVYAVANCTDPNVPNREKKLTLKLLAADNTREIARAYFGRLSKISEMLEDGSYSLSYGNAKAVTVMLRWNTEENPAQPFLEAIAIKALDWNT